MSICVREYEHNGDKQHMLSSAYNTQLAEPEVPPQILCGGSVPPQNLFVGDDYNAKSILVHSNDMFRVQL